MDNNNKNYIGLFLTILTLLLIFLNSCTFDQKEDKFSDFNSAYKEGLFEQGWIPSELALRSMTDIYQRTNLDLNTCVFSYNLSRADIEKIKHKILPIKAQFKKPRRIKIPSWWTESVDKLDYNIFMQTNKNDTIYLAIDDQNNKIYGWRNHE